MVHRPNRPAVRGSVDQVVDSYREMVEVER